MAITLLNSDFSFVRFNEPAAPAFCIWGDINFCLPVYNQEDIYFQFVIQGEEAEIDSLCTQDGSGVTVSLVSDCGDADLITFAEKPARYRLSATQVLFNWQHGLPNFSSIINVGSCFRVQLLVESTAYGYPSGTDTFCSNCMERIASDCFTSVIEYGSDDDAFGFKYCDSGDLEGSGSGGSSTDCSPTIVTFLNVPTLAIAYTAFYQSKYGVFPTVQVWIYDGSGNLLNTGITASFDTYPPTMINLDFGGVSSGIVVIR